ncbi:MAG TPA: DNA primase [Bacteroidales bacterium]|nr:DNA primase [Bacteroidales bacterium]
MISKVTIQRILDAARIEEVINDFVTLKKRGANLIGLCPFHNEKTPSFSVSPSKGIYKCFGCGKAGNVINFIMEHEHYSYPEALRYLAQKYNIDIEEDEQDFEKDERENEREGMFMINFFATEYFTDKLFNTEDGKAIALTYLKDKRGFSDDIIKLFQLGYSTNEWDGLLKAATERGFNSQFLLKTGLVIEKENKKYDLFRGRIIFPIHNIVGRIVGFGGRILTNDKSKPKYVNSPESEIYNKSNILYGIFFAKNAISARNNCFLVEGYTDVISLFQAGIKNVVASSGTSLTSEQIKLIRRYTSNITILYDGDEAGIKASFRGIDMILSEGMNVKVVLFPQGEDPDSFAQNHRPAKVQEYITQNAKDFVIFKTNLMLDKVAHDPVKKAVLVKEIIQTISLIPDSITRSFYIKECSNIMNVSEQALLNELNKQLNNKAKKNIYISQNFDDFTSSFVIPEQQSVPEIFDSTPQEKEIIRILLNYGSKKLLFLVPDENANNEGNSNKKHFIEVSITVAEYVINEIERDNITFSEPVCQKIFNEYSDALKQNNVILDSNHFSLHKDPDVSKVVSALLISPYNLANWQGKPKIYVPSEEENLKKIVETVILSFKSKRVEKQIQENKEKMIKAQAEGNEELLMQLMMHKKILDNLKKLINADKLGRVIIR